MIRWILSLTLILVWQLNAAKLNFLVIVTDDQRPDTIGVLGNPRIDTPNFDWLVRNGITFENFICSNPLCVPSRAEILTGCSGFRNGVLGMGGEKMDPKLILWPTAMKSGGYATWYSGKWMNDGQPVTRGYDETRALFTGGGGTWKRGEEVRGRKGRVITGYRNWTFKNAEGKPDLGKGIGLAPLTDKYIADGALEFLRRKTDKPFFLHVNFTGPHDPLVYPPGYEKKYNAANMKLPSNFLSRHPFDHGNFDGRDERLLPWPRTKADVLDELAVYYAVIDNIDKQVGRLLGQLRADGRLKNTYVIFTSDHGLAIGSHGLMGKQNMYDHTIRVPFLIAGPGIAKGQRTKAFGYLRDMYPTVCELAGIGTPETVQAKSLVPVLRNPKKFIHEAGYGYFRDVQRMVQVGQWKLVFYAPINRYQLFDLKVDPHEMNDLIKAKSCQARVAVMRQSLSKWFNEQEDAVFQSLE
jgi:arylsulfatase A-like enzyme